MHKNCSICKKDLPLDQFYLDKTGRHNFCCTPCDKKRKAVYRTENKEKIAIAEYKYKNTERGYVMEVINGIFSRYKKKNARLKWKPECTKQDIYDELMLYIQDHGRHCEYCKEPWTYKRALGVRGEKYTGRKRAGIESNLSIEKFVTIFGPRPLYPCCLVPNTRLYVQGSLQYSQCLP